MTFRPAIVSQADALAARAPRGIVLLGLAAASWIALSLVIIGAWSAASLIWSAIA